MLAKQKTQLLNQLESLLYVDKDWIIDLVKWQSVGMDPKVINSQSHCWQMLFMEYSSTIELLIQKQITKTREKQPWKEDILQG